MKMVKTYKGKKGYARFKGSKKLVHRAVASNSASARAVSFPIPEVAPVIKTILSFNTNRLQFIFKIIN